MTQDAAHSSLHSALSTSLGSGAAFLAGMYMVARPIANPFAPYSGEAGFTGLVAVLLVFCVGLWALLGKRALCAPDKLTAAVVLWLGLLLYGVLHSANLGVAVPQGCDAAIYILLLLCGYFAARREPALAGILARVLVAMAVVEAFAAVWQHYVDLPAMWREIRERRELLPETLESTSGQYRLYGDEVFGTLCNPNSLAAYLVVGLWLLAGLCWKPAGGQPAGKSQCALGVVLFVLMSAALFFTRSKAGGLAYLAGAWFFVVQRLGLKSPERGRLLVRLTIVGLIVMLAYLALGLLGLCWAPRSLAVRFEYWKAALKMICAHPLSGVGLGGFAEYYPFFKTPLGAETTEAHNDYLHLWAELGVLGPLLYLGLWALLLRRNGPLTLPSPAKGEGNGQAPLTLPSPARGEGNEHDGRSRDLENWAICGGVAGFILMYCAFNVFNSGDVVLLLNGTVNTRTLGSAFHTLALPGIFICVVVGLRPAAAGLCASNPAAWLHGLRAASGAVLIHEIVAAMQGRLTVRELAAL
ncbi:MAG: O-antigen ligase family protein, partial [Planctomycetota bacterium]